MEDGITFGCFLFHSSLLRFFWSQPGTNGVGMGFYHLLMDVEFPHAPEPLNGCHWAVPIGSGTYNFVRVHTQHEYILPTLLSFCLVQFMQPRRSVPKVGDNVTPTGDCGWRTTILYSRLTQRHLSLAMSLSIHLFTITRVHVCIRIPIITICMPTRPNAGVRALTVVSNCDHTSEMVHWAYSGSGIALRWVTLRKPLVAFLLPVRTMQFSLYQLYTSFHVTRSMWLLTIQHLFRQSPV